MRVLKGKILVKTQQRQGSIIIEGDHKRRGFVSVSGSDQIGVGEEVLFGEDFETVTDDDAGSAAILMNEDNVKIIYGEPKNVQ